ncbi:polysaccharide deacetylase family protein [Neobacillus ginsengisoli]|uniref:Peptidoglycan/xylan/chitin deacetylase (PgdA/CDA1 family) n=1 Tax=Neobacillus ginsengisoli TaxID=904295 RepID=A0ABT9XYA3_9BACI|nr:polysaccharide deacetylase family protein [Neobacillus ginsengisoli]MDQ0200552.1 peptidoglycan/xylan/chitin deacetylase (PgdA/CDA1 family) [Neobacillus ginsengisoli]
MKGLKFCSFICCVSLLTSCNHHITENQKGLAQTSSPQPNNYKLLLTSNPDTPATTDEQLKQYLIQKYQVPKEWGENVTGVRTRLNTSDKVIALTFDACGGTNGSRYDSELIYYLRQQQIPATLFINSRWIDANYWTFMALSKIQLFELENHGTLHKPLSINGKSAWGIKGTENVGQIVDEVLGNHRKMEKLLGAPPRFFRSGTAYYDEVGAKIVHEIGEQPVNYNILGDAGATYNRNQVRDALLAAKPGSIAIFHMNHPEGETAEGIKLAIPELKKQGFRFVKLSDYPLQ